MKEVYITIITIILILSAPFFLSMGIHDIPLNIQPSLEQTQKIYGKIIVSESITIPVDNFSIVGVSVKNPNFASKEDLTLAIYDVNNMLIRTSLINGKSIQDGNFIKFVFSPIADSGGKNYLLTFSAPSATWDTAFDIFLTNQKIEGMGPLMVNEKIIPGEISLVSFYKPNNFLSTFSIISGRLLNRVISDPLFVAMYFVLIFVGLGYLLFKRYKKTE